MADNTSPTGYPLWLKGLLGVSVVLMVIGGACTVYAWSTQSAEPQKVAAPPGSSSKK